jgi:hypothetical protein
VHVLLVIHLWQAQGCNSLSLCNAGSSACIELHASSLRRLNTCCLANYVTWHFKCTGAPEAALEKLPVIAFQTIALSGCMRNFPRLLLFRTGQADLFIGILECLLAARTDNIAAPAAVFGAQACHTDTPRIK